MQPHPADECRANALHCADIAEHAHTLDDRSEFFSFAKTWYRLADEIDYCERLISFIDAVAASVSMKEDPERAELESGVNSLMRLTAAIVAISNRFAADRFTTAEE